MDILMQELVNKGNIEINNDVLFAEIDDKVIKKLENVHVNGFVKYNVLEEIDLNLEVTGTMYLNDSITLDEINYDFSFEINETINEFDEYYANFFKNNKNILDIKEILWENIVLEVPISYSKAKIKELKGDGWELNSQVTKGGE